MYNNEAKIYNANPKIIIEGEKGMAKIDVSQLSIGQIEAYRELSKKLDDGLFDDWEELLHAKVANETHELIIKKYTEPLLKSAIIGEDEKLAEALVRDNPDCVNAIDKFGDPLLFYAIEDVKWLNILAKGNLDVNAKNRIGENTLVEAYKKHKMDVVDKLVELGIKLDETLVEGSVPILLATVTHKRYLWLDKLIKLKVDLNVRRKNSGNTALIEAVDNDDEVASLKLIEAGADVNLKVGLGETALMLARKYAIAESLVRNKAEINAVDNLGYTALMKSIQFADSERYEDDIERICKLLLENGADVNAETAIGVTALETAYDSGNKRVIKLIEKYVNK